VRQGFKDSLPEREIKISTSELAGEISTRHLASLDPLGSVIIVIFHEEAQIGGSE
jgi:hypothetical protein